jgi:hypothetical protein
MPFLFHPHQRLLRLLIFYNSLCSPYGKKLLIKRSLCSLHITKFQTIIIQETKRLPDHSDNLDFSLLPICITDYLTVICRAGFVRASSFFGIVILKIPSSYFAFIFSIRIESGKEKLRAKEW